MLKLGPVVFGLAVMICASAFAQTFDVIIRGGHVIDGAGNPWIKADVGTRGGRVGLLREGYWADVVGSIQIASSTEPPSRIRSNTPRGSTMCW